MSQVPIKPELIRWARERSGMSVGALLKHFPKYELWEKGEAWPSLRQLENLAKKTYTPMGYFFLDTPPDDSLPIPDFRTIQGTLINRPSPNLLEMVQTMQRRQAWMRDYLIEEGEEPLHFIGSATNLENPISLANKIRDFMNLPSDWARQKPTWTDALRALRQAIENAHILTIFSGVVGNNTHRKLNVKEFRGFVLCDSYAPLIFVNSADAKAAQMFTLAHELAHLWLGQDGVFNLPDLQPANHDVEEYCNRVAAEFLVPEQDLQAYWIGAKRADDPFQALARHFKVSPLVVARRALDLGLINKPKFLSFYTGYLEDERRRDETRPGGGDFYTNQDMRIGRRFAEAIVRAAKEGRLLYREAYQLTALSGETFNKYAESIGFQF
jgi:Zn-dependent peptidase ImmA (M78 family)